jgi:hypothetical protein
LNPPDGTTVIVSNPLPPCGTVTLDGAAVSLKPLGPLTVSVTVVVALKLPEVPVIVTVALPFFAVLLAVSVSVLEEVAGFGLKTAVTPFGSPEAARVTLPEKPLAGVMTTVLLPLAPPSEMVTVLGAVARLKLD